MRKVILTEKNNVLIFDPLLQSRSSILEANEFVEIAVSYQDQFQKPIFKNRLVWTVLEGHADLYQPTTLTNGKGLGINRIRVKLADPDASATVRLLIYPLNEPDAKLEIECVFGAPREAPPVTETNVLKTVFPRDATDLNIHEYITEGSKVHFLYCDPSGDLIPNKSIGYNFSKEGYDIDETTTSYNDHLYVGTIIDSLSFGIFTITAQVADKKATSKYRCTANSSPTMQLNNFWPPADSILEPGVKYTLKALYTGGKGEPQPGVTVSWTQVSAGDNVTIDPQESITDANGVAVTSLIYYDQSSHGDDLELKVDLDRPVPSYISFVGDNPTFKLRKKPVVQSITPPAGPYVLYLGSSIDFTAVFQADEISIIGTELEWTVEDVQYGELYFSPRTNKINTEGQASSTLRCSNLKQGTTQQVKVKINSPYATAFLGDYTVAARVIQKVEPTNPGPFTVGDAVKVTVQLLDHNFGHPQPDCTLKIDIDDDNLIVDNRVQKTEPDGTATFIVTAKNVCSTIVSVYEPDGPLPTSIELSFGKSELTIDTPLPSAMRYDSWVPLKAQYLDTNNQAKPDVEIIWAITKGKLRYETSTTGGDGYATNFICYETSDGPPAQNVITQVTVTAKDGATNGSQSFTFRYSSIKNDLKLIRPTGSDPHVIGEYFNIVVQLVNEFDTPLKNYPISWEYSTYGTTIAEADPETDSEGKATAKVTYDKVGLAYFRAHSDEALAWNEQIRYLFEEQQFPPYSLTCDNNYAHSSKDGLPVDPNNNGEVVTLHYRCMSGDQPMKDKRVQWSYDPQMGLSIFDDQNQPVPYDYNSKGFFTKTGDDGYSTVKIGCPQGGNFIGTIRANEENNADSQRSCQVVIATFGSGEIDAKDPKYSPQPIEVPEKLTTDNYGFRVTMPFTGSSDALTTVFWIRSGTTSENAEEHIKIVNAETAQGSGIKIPYTMVHAANGDNNVVNQLSYVLATDTSTTSMAKVIDMDVTGNTIFTYLDYTQTRSLVEPYIFGNIQVLNNNNTRNGIDVCFDCQSEWNEDHTVDLNVYLNGFDNRGQKKRNTLHFLVTITADHIREGTVKQHVEKEDLAGYKNATFEADYAYNQVWSYILGYLQLETII